MLNKRCVNLRSRCIQWFTMTKPKKSPSSYDLPPVVIAAIHEIRERRGMRFSVEVVKLAVMELLERVRAAVPR